MSKMNRILKNTLTVGAFTSLSRVLGLVREMLQSRFIGAGIEQSAFTLAFALPNMARKLFGEGALTAAFVPVFKGEVEAQAMDSARRLARSVMTMAILMLVSIVAIVLVGLETVVHFRFDLELSDRALLTIRLVVSLSFTKLYLDALKRLGAHQLAAIDLGDRAQAFFSCAQGAVDDSQTLGTRLCGYRCGIDCAAVLAGKPAYVAKAARKLVDK